MYEIYLKNLKTDSTFTKKVDSPYQLEQYIKKIKYSKTIKYLGYVQCSIY